MAPVDYSFTMYDKFYETYKTQLFLYTNLIGRLECDKPNVIVKQKVNLDFFTRFDEYIKN